MYKIKKFGLKYFSSFTSSPKTNEFFFFFGGGEKLRPSRRCSLHFGLFFSHKEHFNGNFLFYYFIFLIPFKPTWFLSFIACFPPPSSHIFLLTSSNRPSELYSVSLYTSTRLNYMFRYYHWDLCANESRRWKCTSSRLAGPF